MTEEVKEKVANPPFRVTFAVLFQDMDKQDYIEYWKAASEKSWVAAKHLFEKSDYVESLFFAHLTMEKMLKAHWVKDNSGNFPPRTHNIRRLAEKTNLNLNPNQLIFLEQINTFQIEGRYPDYRFVIYKTFDEKKTKLILDETENFYQWLQNKLL